MLSPAGMQWCDLAAGHELPAASLARNSPVFVSHYHNIHASPTHKSSRTALSNAEPHSSRFTFVSVVDNAALLRFQFVSRSASDLLQGPVYVFVSSVFVAGLTNASFYIFSLQTEA